MRGFLIQTRGAHAGLTPVTRAAVTGCWYDAGFQPLKPSVWKPHVELVFEDGSRLSADLVAHRRDWKLTQFETRSHTADVQALLNAPAAAPQPGR